MNRCLLNIYSYSGVCITTRRMSLDSDAKKIYSAAIEAVSPANLIPTALNLDASTGLLSAGRLRYTLKQ